jgi:hypothetical protein
VATVLGESNGRFRRHVLALGVGLACDKAEESFPKTLRWYLDSGLDLIAVEETVNDRRTTEEKNRSRDETARRAGNKGGNAETGANG